MKRIRTNNSVALKRLKTDLEKINYHAHYMGIYTIPSLLILIGNGYAEFTMKDRVILTAAGKKKLSELMELDKRPGTNYIEPRTLH